MRRAFSVRNLVSSSDSFDIEPVAHLEFEICPHDLIQILGPHALSDKDLYQARREPWAMPSVHSSNQFSTRRDGTRSNSRVLAVTSVTSAASA